MDSSTARVGGRPGSAAATPVVERLKAERIQLLLRGLPGWGTARNGTAISRSYRLPSQRAAVAFALYVNELAADRGMTADLDLRPKRITVTLVSRLARGLTQAEFDLAKAIDAKE